MAIQQTKRQSDLEKRLQLLRHQVYGKDSEELRKTQINQKVSGTPISSDVPSRSESFRSDISYLHQDLLKILTLSSLAIGAQIILLLLLKNHMLNLTFF